MDDIPYTNPLEAVQFISIFSYLNTLSDFLFIENFILEDDKNKQIPIINGLCQYLEVFRNDQKAKIKLVRKLLQGSDLYGEKDNEDLDFVFVNAMFDYIISSVVFNKFGNIYGFLAEVVHKADNLQVDHLFEEIVFTLKNTGFENEFGGESFLTPLAVNRIFTDVILMLFPQPKANLNVTSLDYIYAQVGSVFLRSGRLDAAFYDVEKIDIILDNERLFNEYVIMGRVLQNVLLNGNYSFTILRAFALPALLYYSSEHFSPSENISFVVLSPLYWKNVYEKFFLYIQTTEKIKTQFEDDTLYRLHTELSTFVDLPTIAKFFLDIHCSYLPESQKIRKIHLYIQYSDYFTCKSGETLEDVNEWFLKHHLNPVSDAYEAYDLKIIKQSFGDSLLRSLSFSNVVIKLLAPNDYVVLNLFSNETRFSYDLLEFYFPDNETTDYYALLRENYNITLIKQSDNPEEFQQKTDFIEASPNQYHRIILKFSNQTIDVFWRGLIEYKKLRLRSYLKSYDSDAPLGDWWKEFGLSLVPFYPCVTNQKLSYELNSCIIDKNDPKFSDTAKIIESETRSLLTSVGTTVKTLQHYLMVDQEYTISEREEIKDEIMEKLVLHMEEPGSDLTSINIEDIALIRKFIDLLKSKINISFMSVTNMLSRMEKLKKNVYRPVNYSKEISRHLFVRTQNVNSNTGYGYKFTAFANWTAELRTNYTSKKQILVSLFLSSATINTYLPVKIGFITYEYGNIMYEINNQLFSKEAVVTFAELFTHSFNNKHCDWVHREKLVHLSECPRQKRLFTRQNYLNEAVELALRNGNLTRMEIVETLEKYTFPDNERIDLHFVSQWTNTSKIPAWSENYIIENSALLLKLKYDSTLDDSNLSDEDGMLRIDAIYPFKERHKIEDIPLNYIINNYNHQKARYLATFEDYYAIRNFATNGYRRIGADTNEARLMKIALYKLAIRQSDDPDNEFDQTLFKIESMPIEIINRTLNLKKRIYLNKFTLASISLASAMRDVTQVAENFRNVVYEFKFSGPYIRAKIEQLHSFKEKKVILPPGSSFTILNIQESDSEELGKVLLVGVRFIHTSNQKYEWYKNIMKEIT